MVVYIDSLALLNFIINYLLLLASARINGTPFRRLRLALAALLGAAYAVAVWLPGFYFLSGRVWKAASCALMALIAFGVRKISRLARLGVTFIAVSFLLGGAVLAIGLLAGVPDTGGTPYVPIDFKTLFLTAGLSYGVLTLVFRHMGRHGAKETAEFSACWDGRQISVKVLRDSGHTLIEPLSGAEVIILDREAALPLLPPALAALVTPELLNDPAKLLTALSEARFRLIPYRAVGTDCGFLLAFRPDSAEARGGTQLRKLRGCYIGLSPTPLSAGAGVEGLISIEN
ncbi:MAG: sigma-E processing peptidase SpoIIGA [Oscillospiraceae bacterium]|jgi:stage II sporulation protein GA (sporulation sigma-E factor processing peptidase)|nr:sigma-E processing peptidase SpoIIGA [Oscillospiraceae bacterium]